MPTKPPPARTKRSSASLWAGALNASLFELQKITARNCLSRSGVNTTGLSVAWALIPLPAHSSFTAATLTAMLSCT